MKLAHLIRTGFVLGLTLACIAASAQSFPDRPLRLIVGYAPGGGTDNLARMLAKGMSERLNQGVVVENKPGANTIIAAFLERPVIQKILAHLGLDPQQPPKGRGREAELHAAA